MSTITSGMKSARSTRLGGGGDLTAAVADSVAGEGAEGEAGFVVAAPVWGSSRVRQPISTSVRINARIGSPSGRGKGKPAVGATGWRHSRRGFAAGWGRQGPRCGRLARRLLSPRRGRRAVAWAGGRRGRPGRP